MEAFAVNSTVVAATRSAIGRAPSQLSCQWSSTHSHTLPGISQMPRGLGFFLATAWRWPSGFSEHEACSPRRARSSPNECSEVIPARHAYIQLYNLWLLRSNPYRQPAALRSGGRLFGISAWSPFPQQWVACPTVNLARTAWIPGPWSTVGGTSALCPLDGKDRPAQDAAKTIIRDPVARTPSPPKHTVTRGIPAKPRTPTNRAHWNVTPVRSTQTKTWHMAQALSLRPPNWLLIPFLLS